MKTQNYKTMKNSILKITVCLYTILLFTNCSGNDDGNEEVSNNCFTGNWAQEVTQELTNWSTAIQAYSQDPSQENCANYKSTLSDYIDALDDIKECVPTISLIDFNNAIEESREELSNFDCTDN